MKYSNGKWNELESNGLAMQTGALYLRSSLSDDLIDEAQHFDYAKLDWQTDLIAVKRKAPRGLLWRFAWLDKSGIALRYKSKRGKHVHITIKIWPPEIFSMTDFCECFLKEGCPTCFSKPSLQLTKEVGLMMGDPLKGSATILYLNEAKKQLRLVDVVVRTASHAPNDKTMIYELSEEDKGYWLNSYSEKLHSINLDFEGPFTGSYQIDLK